MVLATFEAKFLVVWDFRRRAEEAELAPFRRSSHGSEGAIVVTASSHHGASSTCIQEEMIPCLLSVSFSWPIGEKRQKLTSVATKVRGCVVSERGLIKLDGIL